MVVLTSYIKDRISKLQVQSKVPILRGKINLLFFLLFPIVLYKIIIKHHDIEVFPFYIFSFCASFSFMSSLFLHWKIWDREKYSVLRRIDYAGIFLLIGGGGIPCCIALMNNDFMVVLTSIHWILVFTGVFASLISNFCYTSKRGRSIVYVILSMPYYYLVPVLVKLKYYEALFWLLFGGGFYTLGAFIYGFKFPNLIPGVFEYHELFHIFSLFGFAGISTANFIISKNGKIDFVNKIVKLKREVF